uniref:Uncharacterized protein n=1 Tax=Pyxicephalus adspersus TaxID=30357 RepID=A0AAV3AJC5_PYXAD|nr:TPA: hypothetical protein GDO54_012697 [Pyxicephalus adspersus]
MWRLKSWVTIQGLPPAHNFFPPGSKKVHGLSTADRSPTELYIPPPCLTVTNQHHILYTASQCCGHSMQTCILFLAVCLGFYINVRRHQQFPCRTL